MKGIGRGYLPSCPDRALVLGSGALQIGQAGEFDYSGSQALKALKEEGVYTVLINPNIATIQTSEEFADAVYFLPVDAYFVEQVIVAERIDALLLGFGGQTALNTGLALDASGALKRLGVRVLGTQVDAIRNAEDRELFNRKLHEIDVKVARSFACATPDQAVTAAHTIGLPVILRAAFSLGGKGSAIIRNEADLVPAITRAFSGVPQVLVEECLSGWKEIEYEVVRDGHDDCITVCNMENVDPMGIHTGESIVVAPSQTLNDFEYQMLRDVAIRTIRHLGIVGECNIQYALDPKSTDYRVIEVNPRLSRSSALASKATGYPLAYVAAKIALGYTLPQLANAITRVTTAFFEPAMDYIVCKIPRWDFEKFVGVDKRLGPEMKSVGEVMAIGRSFPEALQKALRMLEIGADGLDPKAFEFSDLKAELQQPSPRRMFAVAHALEQGMTVDELFALTAIDRFFLHEVARIIGVGRSLCDVGADLAKLDRDRLSEAKRAGFSDQAIAKRSGSTASRVRELRHKLDVRPRIAQIDTLAAEYPAETNYLYLTYAADGHDIAPSPRKKILVLGSGCYRIGSSVEFDWCCVNAVTAARELGYEAILLNCNPETVSTDYDICDRLVFDEITMETVLELYEAEKPEGVLVSMGGQTPNNLALKLHRAGVKILGTAPESVDKAEDRGQFSALCDRLKIDQPRWSEATALADVDKVVAELGGFPVLVRPSYVLSGAAMRVAHGAAELRDYLGRATDVSPEHPVVITKFEGHAREVEFDAVADRGEVVLWAVSEHIENAGVHSGDATLVLPPQGLYLETIQRVRRIGARLARELEITGPFNIQFLSRHNEVKVIECNLRASRSFPFVSKVIGTNFIREATRLILGAPRSSIDRRKNPLELDYVAVKAPQFSFRRLHGADPVLGVEMASTGEVACFGDDADEALLKAMMATGFHFPKKGVLLSLGPIGDKYRFTEEARSLAAQGRKLYATLGTAEILKGESIACEALDKEDGDGKLPRAIDVLKAGHIDLVINIPRDYDEKGRPDGFRIRRCAIDLEIPLITDLWIARRVVQAMARLGLADLKVKPWSRYLHPGAAEATIREEAPPVANVHRRAE
ncbi:MAG: carbamoyl-phosphate synthase (glutamine-hydrolyzing) large subunit [Myxococcales bacterium]|nr:carbamoyl-phosphate synthase (glutamine-hydrolyzing) large subunit [Myxococcales bacterium]